MIELPTADRLVTLVEGDCIDRMRELADASVQVVLTDPPAGIGFMGKAWDSFAGYVARTPRGQEVAPLLASMRLAPWAAGFVVFMVDVWTEVARVLVPGGWVCSWALPKTSDLAGLALRLAGLEVVDCGIHLFGSGMPKGCNIGKQLDREKPEDPRLREWCRWLRAEMEARQVSAAAIAERFGFHSRMVDHWAARDTDSQPSIPRVDQVATLLDVLGMESLPDHMVAIVEALNDAKGEPGEAWWRREVLSTRRDEASAARSRVVPIVSGSGEVKVTAPATPEAKAWDGWNTQLAPGWECWHLARRPVERGLSIAANAVRHGAGALNIDACRVPREAGDKARADAAATQGTGTFASPDTYGDAPRVPYSMAASGSYPPNVLLTHAIACEIGRCVDGCPCKALDEQSGEITSGTGAVIRATARGHRGRTYGERALPEGTRVNCIGDTGYASRFFPQLRYQAKAKRRDIPGRATTLSHPTHKHPDLMRWLVRLLAAKHWSPPGPLVLDPFAGSGTTLVACLAEGVRCIGIELDPANAAEARARIGAATGDPESAREDNAAREAGQLALL